jgi:hypothetical protein
MTFWVKILVKKKEIDAHTLQGWLQNKWNTNKQLNNDTSKRLGQTVSIQKTILLYDVASTEYRQLLDTIFRECTILDVCRNQSELIMMIAHQFGLKLQYGGELEKLHIP